MITERKPPGMSQETWVEVQIRRAMEEGKFDNLPGAGKPLRNLHKAGDPLWWAREKARAEGLDTSAMLPPSLRLRKEKQRLHDTIADLPSEKAVREAVEDLNAQIKEHWRAPSGPSVPVALMDLDEALERWRAARPARDAAVAPGPAADAPADDRGRTRTGWWRRIIGRVRA
ncbi:DUF1992 domain-containing protein [Thermopolyspora sp. NPDC052614]|uniref:DnaJ family domain-containing protein n=1 Tax=Thermopolyspora sp. NPDC052614 TaxID=3155682 RepID=UPI00341C95FA